MKQVRCKRRSSYQIYCYFSVIIGIMSLSIFMVWSIKKPQAINGYLSIIKKQTDCYYVFHSFKPLLNQKIQRLLVNNREMMDFLTSNYQINVDKIIFSVIVSCNIDNYYQPAILIYNEISLITYLVDLFWS